MELIFRGDTLAEINEQIENYCWMTISPGGKVGPEETLHNWLECGSSGDVFRLPLPAKLVANRAQSAGVKVSIKTFDGQSVVRIL